MPTVTTVIPVLPVKDLARAHAFYCDVLGFVDPWGFGEPPQYGGVQAESGGWPAIHFTVKQDSAPSEAYVMLEEIDAYYERVRAAGAEFVFQLGQREYGMRDFMVKDPDGNVLSFGWTDH